MSYTSRNEKLAQSVLAELSTLLEAAAGEDEPGTEDSGNLPETAAACTLYRMDGIFAALATSPRIIEPSRWMSLVFSYLPGFSSRAAAERAVELIGAYQQDVMRRLRDNMFIPLCRQQDRPASVWCQGYLVAVNLDPFWVTFDAKESILRPIRSVAQWPVNPRQAARRRRLQEDLPVTVVKIYTMLCDMLAAELDYELARRAETEVVSSACGRNEPCSCGSRKKYKRCCGAPGLLGPPA